MRIIGGHDYFDSAMAYGQDTTLVFQRKKHQDAVPVPYGSCALEPVLADGISFESAYRIPRTRSGDVERDGRAWEFIPMRVWFAGTPYGGVRVRARNLNSWNFEDEYVWDHARLADILNRLALVPKRRPGFSSGNGFNAESLRLHFERGPMRAETEWLIENRVSIAVWHLGGAARRSARWDLETGWKIDVDGLSEIGFAKRLDPFTAFQELSMWYGGVLPRPGPETVEITDEKTLVAKHGMDRWSFRRPPGA